MYYYWYSEEQAKRIKYLNWYLTEEGKEVLVTSVTNSKYHGMNFDDVQFQGRGYKHIRTIENPNYDFMYQDLVL